MSRRKAKPDNVPESIRQLRMYAELLRKVFPNSSATREVRVILSAFDAGQIPYPIATLTTSAQLIYREAVESDVSGMYDVAYDLLAIARGNPSPDQFGLYRTVADQYGLVFKEESLTYDNQVAHGHAP